MRRKAFLFILLTTILIAIAQILFKFGMEGFEFSFFNLITNYFVLLGLLFYGLGSVSLILSFKEEDVSSVYPLIGMVYVWVLLASSYYFSELITYSKIAGLASIIVGVVFITKWSYQYFLVCCLLWLVQLELFILKWHLMMESLTKN